MKTEILALVALFAPAAARLRRVETTSSIFCRIIQVHTMLPEMGEDSDEFHCMPENEPDHQYPVSLPDDILAAHENELENGQFSLQITHAHLEGYEIVTTPKTEYIANTIFTRSVVLNGAQRTEKPIYAGKGVSRVAVVRVSTRDAESSISKARMEEMLDGGTVSFVTQTEACSNGELRYVSAGVHDVYMDRPVDATTAYQLAQDAGDVFLTNEDGSKKDVAEVAEHIMFCLPPGTPNHWIATANSFHWRSWYNDEWCLSLSAAMHELGHNMGLGHAGIPDDHSLMDMSGYMGFSQNEASMPSKCYNGQNQWELGWWDDMTISMDTAETSHQLIRLDAFADLQAADSVLYNIDNTYFAMYNLRKGINSDSTRLSWDKVTITSRKKGGTDLLANLGVGNTWTLTDYRNGQDLMVHACETQGDSMILSVGLGMIDCSGSSQNDEEVEEVAERESLFPTAKPSTAPTRSPTRPPTRSPTPNPTRSPTPRPTGAPVEAPVNRPTPRPTTSPAEESSTPTFLPNATEMPVRSNATNATSVPTPSSSTSFPTASPTAAFEVTPDGTTAFPVALIDEEEVGATEEEEMSEEKCTSSTLCSTGNSK